MTKDNKVIGIICSSLDETHHMKLVQRLYKEFTVKGYQIITYGMAVNGWFNEDTVAGEAAIFELIDYDKIDMLIIFPETIKVDAIVDEILENAEKKGVPIISIDRHLSGCHNALYDQEDAFEKIVRHVIEYHGVKYVNFIAGMPDNEASDIRLNIFKTVLEENDIDYEPERVDYGMYIPGPTYEVMDRFMESELTFPQAIICANDSMAIAVCDYLRRHDIEVPGEVIVTGFDGIQEAEFHTPSITTGSQEHVRHAQEIVKYAEDIMAGAKVFPAIDLRYRLELAQSCGCQMKQLFSTSELITNLTDDIYKRKDSLRPFMQMGNDYLKCEGTKEFGAITKEYLPDNTFLCLNEQICSGEKKGAYIAKETPFSDNLTLWTKLDGNVTKGEITKDELIPSLERYNDIQQSAIIIPLHYDKNIVGYIGTWADPDQKISLTDVLQYAFQFDNTVGYKYA